MSELLLDPHLPRIYHPGERSYTSLTPSQYHLLRHLVLHGRASYLELSGLDGSSAHDVLRPHYYYEYHYERERVQRVVSRLRERIGSARIETVRGYGYKVAGITFLSESSVVSSNIVQTPSVEQAALSLKHLTPRQAEVVKVLVEHAAWTNKQIAECLNVSPDTVKTHLREVYKTLEVRRRAEVVAIALDVAVHPPLVEVTQDERELAYL
jgi:DNA-binding CsgD family transcriptional regulator